MTISVPSGEPEGLWKGRLWALQAGARLPVGPTEVAVRGVRYQRGELQEGLGGRIVPPQAPLSPNCYWDTPFSKSGSLECVSQPHAVYPPRGYRAREFSKKEGVCQEMQRLCEEG